MSPIVSTSQIWSSRHTAAQIRVQHDDWEGQNEDRVGACLSRGNHRKISALTSSLPSYESYCLNLCLWRFQDWTAVSPSQGPTMISGFSWAIWETLTMGTRVGSWRISHSHPFSSWFKPKSWRSGNWAWTAWMHVPGNIGHHWSNLALKEKKGMCPTCSFALIVL